MKHLVNLLTLISLLTGYFVPARAVEKQSILNPPANETPTQTQDGIRVIHSGENGLKLAVDSDMYDLKPTRFSDTLYDQLTLPGGETWGKPGHPLLPVINGLIGVPPGAEVTLEPTHGDVTQIEGQYTLPPGPRPLPLENDLEPGQMIYEPDPDIYAIDEWLPDNPVQLGEDIWIRDQRVMRVSFFPFQYNPARKQLRLFENLEAEIMFSGEKSSSVSTVSAFEETFANILLNYEAARNWRVNSADAPLESLPPNQSLGNRVDISIDQDGIYRVTYEALLASGMDVDNVDPTTFHLFNHGEDVAIFVIGDSDGSFDPGDHITFYGQKFKGGILAERYESIMTRTDGQPGNNWFWLCVPGTCELSGFFEQYTDENIYSLTAGGEPGPRMNTVNGAPTSGTIPTVYTTTVRAEQSIHWWSWEFKSEDVWFWSRIQRSTANLPYTTSYPITLSAVSSGDYNAKVHAEVASRNLTTGYPDHHTQFTINNVPDILDDAYWDGRDRYAMTTQIPQGNLIEGVNNLHFTMLPDVAPGTTQMYFDFFEVTYYRNFVAENNQLAFTRYDPGTWRYVVDGFTNASIDVFDVTNPFEPVRVLNPGVTGTGPYSVSFRNTDGSRASYFIAGASNILAPGNLTVYAPPDFANMPEADYVFITHEDFITALQPLVAYRQSQGFSVAVIDVDDLYREFNDGIYNPIAIKNFLAFAFADWEIPPAYVTLIGSGHWNFKNYGAGQPYYNPPEVYMPPNLAYIDPWQGQTDATNLLATLVGNDTMPDLYIGRIPVSSAAELNVVINKIIGYEQQPVAEWQQNITFIADNIPDNAGNFVQLAENIINDYLTGHPYYHPVRIYQNDYGCSNGSSPQCQAVTHAITSTMGITGTLLINYIGHGSLDRWSGESILLTSDIPTISNPDRLPVILSMTCLDGYWTYPNIESIARLLLISEGKGAVATFSPTGLGVATGHDDIQRGFFSSLFNQGHWEMGDAALRAKARLFASNNNFDLMHTFTVFGDPALRIKTPYGVALSPESAGEAGMAGETLTYTLQLENIGVLTDTFTVTLSGNAWDANVSQTVIGPLPSGGTASFSVTVNIPPTALGNSDDTLRVQATSKSATYHTDQATLISTALTDGLLVTPILQTGYGTPGEMLAYSIQVTNTSNTTDIFTVTSSSNSWDTLLPTQVGPILPGQSESILIWVTIPAEALGNDTDQIYITIRSQLNSSHAALARVISTAVTDGLSLTPTELSGAGIPGASVSYVLQLTNLLNTAEYYETTISGSDWSVTLRSSIGPVNPGRTISFLATVNIPENAQPGTTEAITLTVSLLDTPDLLAATTLYTFVNEPPFNGIYLPMILRP